jgi:hypothetical protein
VVLDHLILGSMTFHTSLIITGSSFDVKNKEYMDQMKVGWILNVADELDNLYPHSVRET